MNLCRVLPAFVIFLYLLNAFISATNSPTYFTDDASVNCGSRGTSASRNNREWFGDVHSKLEIQGSSSVLHKLTTDADPVPYKTARLSRSRFSYAFHVNSGQKIIRLHFNPAPYRGYKRHRDLFAVEVGPFNFTLLSNFSASLTADALGVNYFVKEYCINIKESQRLDLIFTPASSRSLDTYAFINGIQMISVPTSLSYFHGGDIGVQEVGKSLVYVNNNTVLETIRRLNVKQGSFSSNDEVGDIFGMWETVPERKASKVNYITWKTPVDVGFKYLARLHFSKAGFKLAQMGGITFKVCINEMIVDSNSYMMGEWSDENNFPSHRDYMVMMQGNKQEGKRDLLICLQSNDDFLDGQRPLKGFEIMKLSNPDNSLVSPNPMPKVIYSSYRTIRYLLHVLGQKNVIATVAIAILALLNTVIYVVHQISETSVAEEENKPSTRAARLCRRFSLADIQLATENFNETHLIGKGGFGKVYKGIIDKGRKIVAIKRLKPDSKQGTREFLAEIETLTELRHVNLVTLIGYCNEHWEMILVYEYMSHGTLADHVYKLAGNRDNGSSLTWKQRLNICIQVGRGLDYLHTGHPLVHRDIKASNILLDENFTAKLSDFGLAKHLSGSKLETHVSTKVKGTFGYLDPNYITSGKLTRKSDTYAFGVLLLVVLSGRRALDPTVAEDERILTKWAQASISKGKTDQIVASNLRSEISADSLRAFVGIAERCLHDEPKKRPTMTQVVVQLECALEQQESSNSSALNSLNSDMDDILPSNDNSLSIGIGQLTMASQNVPNLTLQVQEKEQTNSGLVNAEQTNEQKEQTNSETKDVRKETTHKPSRPRTWDSFWNRVKPVENNTKPSGNPIAVPAIPLLELKDITDNFSDECLINEDYNGPEYYGILRSGRPAAIKKVKWSQKSDEEFLEQVSKVYSLKHENVVELLGYCVADGLHILAYEHAPNGSLYDTLHGQKSIKVKKPKLLLSWAQRAKIAVQAANGLEYLHQNEQIHGGITSSTVFLFDDCHVAKIRATKAELSNMSIRATEAELPNMSIRTGNYGVSSINNMDPLYEYPFQRYSCDSPEYPMSGQLSFKSDVYSFGVVLLELLTGLEPFDHTLGHQSLVTWARTRVSEHTVHQLVDLRLNGNWQKKEVAKMAAFAARCVHNEAYFRPEMSNVVKGLQTLLKASYAA